MPTEKSLRDSKNGPVMDKRQSQPMSPTSTNSKKNLVFFGIPKSSAGKGVDSYRRMFSADKTDRSADETVPDELGITNNFASATAFVVRESNGQSNLIPSHRSHSQTSQLRSISRSHSRNSGAHNTVTLNDIPRPTEDDIMHKLSQSLLRKSQSQLPNLKNQKADSEQDLMRLS